MQGVLPRTPECLRGGDPAGWSTQQESLEDGERRQVQPRPGLRGAHLPPGPCVSGSTSSAFPSALSAPLSPHSRSPCSPYTGPSCFPPSSVLAPSALLILTCTPAPSRCIQAHGLSLTQGSWPLRDPRPGPRSLHICTCASPAWASPTSTAAPTFPEQLMAPQFTDLTSLGGPGGVPLLPTERA